MVNCRHQLNFPDGQGNFPPLAIIDVEKDLADENLAENLFMELRDEVTNINKIKRLILSSRKHGVSQKGISSW